MPASALYPEGNTPLVYKWVSGVLTAIVRSTQATLFQIDPSGRQMVFPDAAVLKIGGASILTAPRVLRTRVTVSQINAGATLLPAISGYKYQMISCLAIAYGGAVTGLTTLDILGTQSTAQKLVAYAQASLTQSTVLTSGGSGAAVLADGASYVQCDANTAITVGKTGGSAATATGVDVIITYTVGL